MNDGLVHVDFPASSPYVVGCGGTKIDTDGNRIEDEIVWNSNGAGTGGGVSTLFAVPKVSGATRCPVFKAANVVCALHDAKTAVPTTYTEIG